MKHICEFLSSRATIKEKDFLEDTSRTEVIKFLVSKGFKEVPWSGPNKFYSDSKNSKVPIYSYGSLTSDDEKDSQEDLYFVIFTKGGVPSKKSPQFFMKNANGEFRFEISDGESTKVIETKKEFKEIVVNYFKW